MAYIVAFFLTAVLIYWPIGFLLNVLDIIKTHHAVSIKLPLLIITALLVGLSRFPPLDKMYVIFPWLAPFVKIMFTNAVILSLGLMILNMGYIYEESADVFFYGMLMIIVLCRTVMCFYYNNKDTEEPYE